MRPRYVPIGNTTYFYFLFTPRETTSFEDNSFIPINQTGYILNIDGARDR